MSSHANRKSSQSEKFYRFCQWIESVRLTPSEISQRLERAPNYLGYYIRQEKLPPSIVMRILADDYGLNLDWIETGEGEMTVEKEPGIASEPQNLYGFHIGKVELPSSAQEAYDMLQAMGQKIDFADLPQDVKTKVERRWMRTQIKLRELEAEHQRAVEKELADYHYYVLSIDEMPTPGEEPF